MTLSKTLSSVMIDSYFESQTYRYSNFLDMYINYATTDNPDFDLEDFKKDLLESPHLAYEFAYYVKGADIEELQDAAVKDAYWAFMFAKNIPGANIEIIEDAILHDPFWVCQFALCIPNANVEKLEKHMGEYQDYYNQFIIKEIIE